MTIRIGAAVTFILLGACAASKSHQGGTAADCQALDSGNRYVEGRLKFGLHDTLSVDGGIGEEEQLFILREPYFSERIEELNGREIAAIVTAVDACDLAGGSSEKVCLLLTESGTAFKVKQICEIK